MNFPYLTMVQIGLNFNTVDSRIISAMGGAGANGHGSTSGSYSGSQVVVVTPLLKAKEKMQTVQQVVQVAE